MRSARRLGLAATGVVLLGGVLVYWLQTSAPRVEPSGTRGPASPAARGSEPASSPSPRAPGAEPPARRASDSPVPSPSAPRTLAERFLTGEGEPTEAMLRAAIEGAIRERLPSHKLSSDELDRLADAASRLRQARSALRSLPEGSEHAEQRRALHEEIAEADAAFFDVLEMSLAELTERALPGGGIDAFSPDEAVPEAEYLKDRPPR